MSRSSTVREGARKIGRAVAGRVASGVKRRARRLLGRIPGLGGDSPDEPAPDAGSDRWVSTPAAPLHEVPAPASPFAAAAPGPSGVAAPDSDSGADSESGPDPEVSEVADDVVGPPLTQDQVEALFEDMVRPALRSDGGDIDLLKVEDNDVYVRLMGACSSCPSSTVTMKMGVERLLAEEFPQFRNLIQVA